MIIAVDYDEVLFPLVPELVKWHNVKYGTALRVQDFRTYRFWEAWGGTKKEAIVKYIDFVLSEYSDNIMPLNHALETLSTTKTAGHRLIVISASQLETVKAKERRLHQHFPGIFDDFHAANNYALQGPSTSKAVFCRIIKPDVMIDDNIEQLLECRGCVRFPILFGRYPWNQQRCKVLPRVRDWFAVEKLLDIFLARA